MAKKWTQKKVNRAITSIIVAGLLVFTALTSLSENGYLPFSFPRWRDFGSILGQSNTIEDSPVSVHFIDVGNADCTYIKTPDGNILLDAGNPGDEDKIVPYLRQYRVEKLDYVIATHPHADHIGAMAEVLKSFDVGEFIMPEMPETIMPTTQAYKDMLSALQSEGIKSTYAEPGRVIELGEAKLKLFSPLDEYDSINNMSIVSKFTYKDFSVMLTGDAESVVEEDLLDQYTASMFKADVLKVGHHGSSSSSTPAFLQAVNARIFFIPCGAGNSYGHPHKETLSALKKFNGEIYRADYDGTVVIVSDGTQMQAIKE